MINKNFNKYVCVKATLECLGTFTSDANMTNSSIAICSQAALNVSNLRILYEIKNKTIIIQILKNFLLNRPNINIESILVN